MGRCVAHFAVDENEVRFCTHLTGKTSWFLPFNRGWNDGAGNPPNPNGLKTNYLWSQVLTRTSLTNILENYAQVVATKDQTTGRKKRTQIWPRYHQIDAVRRLLTDVSARGSGNRYLIHHSAGSGKSNSIAWLAHQLIRLARDDAPIFDSIIVVTDRRILDNQIQGTIKQYAQIAATVGHADESGDLRRFIETGKKIIISTVQKFPYILDEIGNEQRGRSFAIIIDEAHSSQGGRTAAAVAQALSDAGREEDGETFEDQINRLMESRKLLPNASYFAFTATPKNKTLELFGDPDPQPDGTVKHRAFHSYTMKQAIQEGFILDVLKHYTPVTSFYRLAKTVEEDPDSSTRRKPRRSSGATSKGTTMRFGSKPRSWSTTFTTRCSPRARSTATPERWSSRTESSGPSSTTAPFASTWRNARAGTRPSSPSQGTSSSVGRRSTRLSLNGFPARAIAERFQEDPYRFLVCADKFQTGYDEPLLHTMYVDKTLAGIKAVQTLSRLNRAHPKKHDVFVLDFLNDAKTIQDSFANFYRATILADETDPNKLHDLQAELDAMQIYSSDEVDEFARCYLAGAERDQLDPILDACVAVYLSDLDEDGQVAFKGKAKAFARTYAFLSSVLPYTNPTWEKRSIFLNFLISKLPAPQEEDLSKGILDAIDMDSYRVEKRTMQKIALPDADAEIESVPTSEGGHRPEPDLDRLSNILSSFNDLFGDIEWDDRDRVHQLITKTIPARVAADTAFSNARENSDKENARLEHDKALVRVITAVMKDDTELFKQFMDNEGFKRWMTDTVFSIAYKMYPNETRDSCP